MTGGEQGEQSRRGPGLSPLPLLPEKDHQTEGFRRYLSSGVPRLPAAASPSPGKLLELSGLKPHTSSVQFSSVPKLCPTLFDPMDCSTPGFPVHHQLPELAQTHVHRVSDAIQPSFTHTKIFTIFPFTLYYINTKPSVP